MNFVVFVEQPARLTATTCTGGAGGVDNSGSTALASSDVRFFSACPGLASMSGAAALAIPDAGVQVRGKARPTHIITRPVQCVLSTTPFQRWICICIQVYIIRGR